MVKVSIVSPTGITCNGELFPESGVIEIGGEWSTIGHEKALNKTILTIETPAPEQSKARPKEVVK
jgi:hypothetical protein